MKRTQIKKRPMSDTTLATLEPDEKEYREQNGNGLYFRVKPDGKKAWVFIMALRRLGYEGRQSPHGFRHIASSTLREKGFLRDHVEAALAHKVGGVEGVYNKAGYLADRIPMMQWWSDYLEGLRTDSNVIPFSKAANV